VGVILSALPSLRTVAGSGNRRHHPLNRDDLKRAERLR
jgi:hypothetical protein